MDDIKHEITFIKAQMLLKADKESVSEIRERLHEKADRADITTLATAMSAEQLNQSERNRAMQSAVGDVARAVKALEAIVATEPGAPLPRPRFSLRGVDPRLLIAGGLGVGVLVAKFPELKDMIPGF